MRWTPVFSFAAAAVVSVALAETAVLEAVSELSRPESPPQGDAHGTCDVRTGPDFDRFRIVVEGVNAEGTLRVFLGDGRETLNLVGEMPGGSRVRTFLRTTLEGGELPYGVESVRSLAERRIEIRDGESRVVLRGHVPVIREETGGGGDDGEEPPPPAGEPVVTRSEMRRTEEAGDRVVRGILVATRRADGSSLRLELARFAPETALLVYLWVEDDLVLWDDVRTNREGGAALSGDTAEGPGLPLGADSVVDLAGRRVEVRDRDGRLLLYGRVPEAETERDEEPVREETEHEDEESGADVRVEAEIVPERGREELTIVVRDLPRERGAAKAARRFVEVRMDDGTGSFETVATSRVRRGRARVRWDSRRGDELPFGAESVRALSGRGFQMFLGGTRVASGTLPQL